MRPAKPRSDTLDKAHREPLVVQASHSARVLAELAFVFSENTKRRTSWRDISDFAPL